LANTLQIGLTALLSLQLYE